MGLEIRCRRQQLSRAVRILLNVRAISGERPRQVFDSILEGVWSGSDDRNSSDGYAGVDGGGLL